MADLVYPFLQLSQSVAPYSDELKEAAARVIDSGHYLMGPETDSFERELAEYCESEVPALGVSNGLDALRLIFRSYIEMGRLRPGDEVIVPANTYIASILPVSEFGLKPVFVEPSEQDFNLDLKKGVKAITRRTRAVLPVHLYGNPAWDAEGVEEFKKRQILIIEDNAQAIGALAPSAGLRGSRHTGNLGDAAAFSFYPTKNLGAIGDAGAILTSDEELRATAKALANYGSDRRYHNIYRGYNCRMDELQAAMLRVRLRYLEEETHRRRMVAEAYNSAISHPEITLPEIFADRRQVWHQYPIHTGRRDELIHHLANHGIATDIHYATPPHRQPCYAADNPGSFPITDHLAETEISLPIANLTPADAYKIAEIINDFK